MNQEKTCRYIISLIRALLEGRKPEEKSEDITFEDIYRMARKHNVRNMCFYAVEKLEEKPAQELFDKWAKQTAVSSAQSAVQLLERDSIIRLFQNENIDCLPMKGCFLKEMYPEPGYREMSDLDILIRKDSEKKVREIMESNGYRTELFGHGVHDVYKKPPFMSVEIHTALTADDLLEKFSLSREKLGLITDPWNYAVPEDRKNVYTLSHEDTYIFLILHLAKHFFVSGVGIRQFIDIWIYSRKYDLDKTYIHEKLKGSELEKFLVSTEELVNAWLSDGTMTDELEEMQKYIFSSGVYGSMDHRVANGLRKVKDENKKGSAKLNYLLVRFFPPVKAMKKMYPYLDRYPVLLPFTWMDRLARKLFGRNTSAVRELRAFIKAGRTEK